MEMEMTMGARRGNRKGREAMVERRHGGVGPLEELWHPEQLTCEGCDWEVPCWWHAPGARRISSLALYACRHYSLHGWPLVCAFRRGREERQLLSAFCIFVVVVIAAVGSTDLLPLTKCQIRSGLRPSFSALLRRSLLLHRGPVLAWKRRRRLDSALLLQ